MTDSPSERLRTIVSDLLLPKNGWAIGGSGVLAMRDLRDVRDVDVFVRPWLWQRMRDHERPRVAFVEVWQDQNDQLHHSDPPFLFGSHASSVPVNVFYHWKHPGLEIDVQAAIDQAEDVNGVSCIPLNYVLQWKEITQRPKDVIDIGLINDYLASGGV